MRIDWNNREEIDKLYIHDSLFEGFRYNYEERQIQLDCENDWLGKSFHFTFQNVIFCSLQSCNFWGPGPHILSIYLEEDTLPMRELIKTQEKNQKDYAGSCLDTGIPYLQVGMKLNSGDELLIGCECVEYTEEIMDKPERAYLNWSSGKDSAMALYYAQKHRLYDVWSLFTVIKKNDAKIAMHEIGRDLLVKQTMATGIPLNILECDFSASEEEYQRSMEALVSHWKHNFISTALFGDLYLQELRNQREENCKKQGMRAAFPLWGSKPEELMHEFIRLGFKSIVTCVDGSVLDESFLGRVIDEEFLRDLPANVDICGENGEYHSFVFDGPIFNEPVEFQVVGKYYRDYPNADNSRQNRYWYLELK